MGPSLFSDFLILYGKDDDSSERHSTCGREQYKHTVHTFRQRKNNNRWSEKVMPCPCSGRNCCCIFSVWEDESDSFQPGDIIYLSNGIFSFNRNCLCLRAGKKGRVQKVGEFTLVFVETPNMSELRWAPDPENSRKYVQESVISPYSRVFPPIS